jgi:predicted acyl esterase
MRIHVRIAIAFTCALLLLPALVLDRPSSSAATGPLVTDSLDALDSLVADANCETRDAADDDTSNGTELPYVFCDDGLPPPTGGVNGIPVPVKYRGGDDGNDWTGLPPPAPTAEAARADARHDLQPEPDGRRITLDVDISLPVGSAPLHGRPVIVFMHGCCNGNKTSWEAGTIDAAGEKWHHSNAWFAARGYVVITYTARGFRNASNQGSTGTTQLDSRRFEINDYQYLVGLLSDHDARRRAAGEDVVFDVNERRIAAVGGSYGGGFAWLALTDPHWRSPADRRPMRLGAAVPKYGWTDLVEALVPSGHYFDRDPKTGRTFVAPSKPSRARSRDPIGVEKQSIVSGLYASGNLVTGNHTTFPDYIHDAYARLQQGEPYSGDPVVEKLATQFLRDRSAYFQSGFWSKVRRGTRIPAYVPATWTDPLFTTMESMRFYNKLEKIAPRYPMQVYLGDYQHFTQNKAKEWGDMCGRNHHVCTIDDFRDADGDLHLNRAPENRVRSGINTRINRFLDHFLKSRGRRPSMNVSATTTICPSNANRRHPADEPGDEYRAPSWRALAPNFVTFARETGGVTTSDAVDRHASDSDPVFRGTQSNKCYTTSIDDRPGPGVVQFTSSRLSRPLTLMGVPSVKLAFDSTGTDYWIAARLFDVGPGGNMTMVTRGVCRTSLFVAPTKRCHVFDLFGNGWRFRKGHRILLEVTQGDTPFLRRDNFPSALDITVGQVELPVAPRRKKVD